MKKLSLIFSLIFYTTFLNAQSNRTFFNKRIVLDFSGTGTFPLVANPQGLLDEKLRTTGRSPSFGYIAQLSYAFTRKFMLGVSYAHLSGYAAGPEAYRESNSNVNGSFSISLDHERFKTNKNAYGLVFAIGSGSSILPGGTSFQVGIERVVQTIVDKDYNFRINDVNNNGLILVGGETLVTQEQKKFISQYEQKVIRIILEPMKRIPITKNLAFNYGIRMQLSFGKISSPLYSQGKFDFSDGDVSYIEDLKYTFIMFKSGFSLML